MITLFIGDSFTWGQGLQYYSLMQTQGWSYADCDKFYKALPEKRFELLGFEADEFRKQNGFPAMVSKHINLSFSILNLENGGDNKSIYDKLNALCAPGVMTLNNISMIIIQFSNPARSISQGVDTEHETIEESIKEQIERVNRLMKMTDIEWLALSWEQTLGNILKESYPDNHIPILYDGAEWNSFDMILGEISIAKETNRKITDDHFSMKGHRVIADSIISKIYSRKDLVNRLNLGEKQ